MIASSPALVQKLIELQIITAEEGERFGDVDICRTVEGVYRAMETLNTNNKTLMAENTALQTQVKAQAASDADKFITLACEKGKLPAKNEAILKYWKDFYVTSPKMATEMIEAINGAPVNGTPSIDVKAEDNTPAARGANIMQTVEAQRLEVARIAKRDNLSQVEAFNVARREKPQLFID